MLILLKQKVLRMTVHQTEEVRSVCHMFNQVRDICYIYFLGKKKILCVKVFCLHGFMYTPCMPGICRGLKWVLDPQELELV